MEGTVSLVKKTVTVLNAFTIRGIVQYRKTGRGGSGETFPASMGLTFATK